MVSFTKVILPAVLGSFVPAFIFWDLARDRHIFGGAPAVTYADPNWEKEALAKFDSGWEREAGSPVVMNPISRQNFRKL
ncbi:unnamed protein product [Calypogeia fissa]